MKSTERKTDKRQMRHQGLASYHLSIYSLENIHILMFMVSFMHHIFLAVFCWLENDNVALWSKNTKQKTISRSQNRKNMHSHGVFTGSAHVDGNESDPHRKENEHAERNEFSFIEIVRQLTGQIRHEEAQACQEADIAENTPEADLRAGSTLDNDGVPEVACVAIGERWVGE